MLCEVPGRLPIPATTSLELFARQGQVSTWLAMMRFASQHGAIAWVLAQVVDEQLAGSSVEYLGFN